MSILSDIGGALRRGRRKAVTGTRDKIKIMVGAAGLFSA